MIKEINKNSNGILDRSIYGDKIFAEMLNEDEKMTNEEYNTYETLLNNMLEHVQPPHLMIYLKCKTETATKRVAIRNRSTESYMPITYWQRLNQKYDIWYNNYNSSEKMCFEVDDFNVFNEIQREELINEIKEKIKTLYI